MAEIPAGEYTSHIHRSIDQLRQMNEKNAAYTLGALSGTTDLRLHDYKLYSTDLRINGGGGERIDYTTKDIDRSGSANNNNNNNNNNMQSGDPHEPVDQKPYIGSPGTPPTPLSITDAQMNESKIFASKSDLQIHGQVHMRESKPYKCSQCPKCFANSSYLSQHTRIHLGIKPYRCEICQRKFTQLSHLQQHIRTHTGDKPYKCRHTGCPKAFSQLSNLQSHSRCHQTDKPYKCNSCYKCFVDEAGLLEHIPKHKESKHLKTHICQYCGKSYTQETYLTKHMQKHIEKEAKKSGIAGLAGLGFNKNLPNPVDHPYWPKVSPDSAANMAEAIQQQQTNYEFLQQQQQQHNSGQNPQNHTADPQHHRLQDHHHHRLNGANPETGEDLVVIRQNNSNNLPNLQNAHPPVTSAPPNTYDTAASITKVTSNSAFTPIQTMMPHQLAQRPYFYDAINFQAKNAANQGVPNSFPNQLISLHQIRNYAHQPGIVSGEHLLAMGVGVKDKGQ